MPSRRQVFRTVTAAASVLATRPLHARIDRVGPLVARSRETWERRVNEAVAMNVEGHEVSPAQLAELRHQTRGLLAADAFRDVASLSIEDQQHPAYQSFIVEVAEALGESLNRAADRLTAWLDDPETGSDMGMTVLAEQVELVYQQAGALDIKPNRQRLFQGSISTAERRPSALRFRARQCLRRIQKLQRVAARIHADPTRKRLHRVPTGETSAKVRAGQLRWGAPQPITSTGATIAAILGIIALGLVIVFGAYLAIVGACLVLCSVGEGVGLLVLGLALVAGAIVGIVLIVRHLIRNRQNAVPLSAGQLEPAR